ncbi:MAG: hypothetical protein HPY44_00655 [Armatimonadetes bacterium]|nr:hypothetical protein [Armatimonadota bacterium]
MKATRLLVAAGVLLALASASHAQAVFGDRPRLDDRPTLRDRKKDGLGSGRLRNDPVYWDGRSRLDDRATLRDRKNEGLGSDRVRNERSYWWGRPRLDDRPLSSDVQTLGEGRYWDDWWQEEPVEEPVFVIPFRPQGFLPSAEVCLECGELPIELTVQPLVLNGVLYIAARDYFPALGASLNYNATYRSAIAVMPDGRWLVIPLGHSYFYINQQLTLLAQPTAIANNILMIPVRAMSEKLGFGVRWDPVNNTAVLVPPITADEETGEPATAPDEGAPAPQTE